MTRPDSDDSRFEELMSREFPDGLVPTERQRPVLGEQEPPGSGAPGGTGESSRTEVDSVGPPEPEIIAADQPRSGSEPSGVEGFRSWTPPEEPEEPFSPPPLPPARRWTPAGIVGTVLVVLPLVLMLVAAMGVRYPLFVSVLAGIGFVAGVILLLHRLGRRPPADGDGAVV